MRRLKLFVVIYKWPHPQGGMGVSKYDLKDFKWRAVIWAEGGGLILATTSPSKLNKNLVFLGIRVSGPILDPLCLLSHTSLYGFQKQKNRVTKWKLKYPWKKGQINQHGTNRYSRVEPTSPVEIINCFFFHVFCNFSPQLRESRFTTGWTGSARENWILKTIIILSPWE